jgi:hypothetical protein
MCIGPTNRQRRRSTLVPKSAARSSMVSQWAPSTSKPPALVAPSESSPAPKRPASRGPAGETWAATAISKSVRGRSWSRASRRVNQSVSRVTGSSHRRRARMASNASSIISRWRLTSMPIMKASDGNAPGPTPNWKRPRVRWSSNTIRSARIRGWW